jgi:hypothetical protein
MKLLIWLWYHNLQSADMLLVGLMQRSRCTRVHCKVHVVRSNVLSLVHA